MQTIKLDISKKNNVQRIYVKQRDVGHEFAIELYENGIPYWVEGNTFAVWYSGSSGEGNYDKIGDEPACVAERNQITVQMIKQMLNKPGKHEMCVVMYGQDNEQKGFWNIPYHVEEIPGADSEAATDYYNAFLQAQENAENAADRAELAADRAEEAAGGKPVSKYFAITDDGILSLKEEYQFNGSKNSELPKQLVIPETVTGITVKAITAGAFYRNMMLESVTIPGGVTAIPNQCFMLCTHLTEVFTEGTIEEIGESALAGTSIKKASFPSLKSLGAGAFNSCYDLEYAAVGNVTVLPDKAFNICQNLYELKGESITSVGAQALFRTFRLAQADFVQNLTSIGKLGFYASGFDYDWDSLTECTFGEYATSKQLNPTDFWSDLTIKECENPLPTLFCQGDERWIYKTIGSTGIYYGQGCLLFSFIHAYCGLKGIKLDTLAQFESEVNAISPNILDIFDKKMTSIEQIAKGLGLNVEMYYSYNAESLQALYTALADGKYAIVTVETDGDGDMADHAVMVYGVRADGSLAIADSAISCRYDRSKGETYALPYKTFISPDQAFIILSLPRKDTTLTDTATGTKYRLYVENGELKMEVAQ